MLCPLRSVLLLFPVSILLTSLFSKKLLLIKKSHTKAKTMVWDYIPNIKSSLHDFCHRLSFNSAGRWNCIRWYLGFDIACSNQRIVSPLFCGSNPYPCSSLTYRNYSFRVHHTPIGRICQRFFEKIKIFHRKSRK